MQPPYQDDAMVKMTSKLTGSHTFANVGLMAWPPAIPCIDSTTNRGFPTWRVHGKQSNLQINFIDLQSRECSKLNSLSV